MAQPISIIQNNFTSGELSERMLGRTDTNQYYNAAKELTNFILLPQGGLKRRSGTRFADFVKYHNKKTRLIPFIFSTEQAYVLEFGDYYLRIYKNGGLLLDENDDILEVVTPYSEDDIADLWYTQSADIMTICHGSHPVKELKRFSETNWTLTDKDFIDGPYGDINKTGTTLNVSAKTGTVTVTASANLFTANDVGRHIRILQGKYWGALKITSYTSATQVQAKYFDDFDLSDFDGTLAATLNWKLGAFNSTDGYPKFTCYYKERLWFAGTKKFVSRYWSSKTNDFDKFSTTDNEGEVLDDCGIDGLIADDGVNAITYLSPLRYLAIGTTDGEFLLSSASSSYVFSTTNYKVEVESHYGGSSLKPIRAHSTSVFAQRDNKKLYQYSYDYNSDSYKGSDISLLAEHITRGGIKELTYSQQPNTLIYTVLTDGTIAACTFLPEQKVIGWQRIKLGGTNVKVKSITTIPNKDRNYDEVWVIVERTINGQTVQYVEYFQDNFDIDSNTTLKQAFFVDSGLSLESQTPVSHISGLNHLIGETVSILADGAVQEDRVVDANGELELTYPANIIHIGLPFTSRVVTMPIYIDQQQQTMIGNKKMIYKIDMYFHSSLGGKFGFEGSLNPLREIFTRKSSDDMDKHPPLFTGVKHQSFPNGYSTLPAVIIEQSQPLPMNLNALAYSMVVSDG